MPPVTPDDPTEVHPPAEIVAPPADVQFAPGSIIAGRYRIVALLGAGGMGEVYRADDLKLGQRVALKYVPPRVAANPRALERLYAEVRIGRQISHRNVCRLYDLVEVEGHRFIAMEYVDGEDLASLLRRIGRLPADKALALTRDLCAGLAAAHDGGVVHRDLKPANVMIDGRGTARITDFGLAVLESEQVNEFAGTPAYMAPEQLRGGAASVRSDLYALGLVLYEMFTGRRLFDGRNVAALLAQHAQTKTRPSSAVGEIDPAVETVILRCLEEDPQLRPASVHAVLAALPGGDPLQAAIAAGETPSPEMVAAAGRTGELPVARAWMFFALFLLLLAGVVVAREAKSVISRIAEIKSPEALDDRARTILRNLGYRERPRDAKGLYVANRPYIHDAIRQGSDLRTLSPAAAPYLYRDSPAPMMPSNASGWIRRNDPPLLVPGMSFVLLDAEGKLRELRRVALPKGGTTNVTPDWSIAFREAGLDMAHFQPTAPEWMPPVSSDRRYAWSGEGMRVEAASAAGRPVWFLTAEPWSTPLADADSINANDGATGVVLAAVFIAAAIFARRNVVRGRADLRGAWRVAFVIVTSIFVGGVAVAHHLFSAPGYEWGVLSAILGQALFLGLVGWLTYLAVEPYLRSMWPEMLVGWTRLVGGRTRDALVGREVLIGFIAGAAGTIANCTAVLLLTRVAPVNPLATVVTQTPLGLVNAVLVSVANALTYAFGFVTMLVCFRLVLRRTFLAWTAIVVVVALVGGAGGLSGALEGTALGLAMVFALRYAGLLGGAAAFFLFQLAQWTPFTLDPHAWYGPRMIVTLLLLAALAAFAFRNALAGKPLFGSLAVEDRAAV